MFLERARWRIKIFIELQRVTWFHLFVHGLSDRCGLRSASTDRSSGWNCSPSIGSIEHSRLLLPRHGTADRRRTGLRHQRCIGYRLQAYNFARLKTHLNTRSLIFSWHCSLREHSYEKTQMLYARFDSVVDIEFFKMFQYTASTNYIYGGRVICIYRRNLCS